MLSDRLRDKKWIEIIMVLAMVAIGRTSGGGACVVQPGITADGTRFCISSDDKLCTVKNGTLYPIDQGVEPDFTIGDPKHFYDREWLTDYINTLP